MLNQNPFYGKWLLLSVIFHLILGRMAFLYFPSPIHHPVNLSMIEVSLKPQEMASSGPIGMGHQVANRNHHLSERRGTLTTEPNQGVSTSNNGSGKSRLATLQTGNPAPLYPRQSRKNGEQGTVILAVTVSADGAPVHIHIVQSSGYVALDSAAKIAVMKWKFEAATLGGIPVEGIINIPIQFLLSD